MIFQSNATHRVSFDKNLTSLALESTEHHSKALIAVVVSHLAKVNHIFCDKTGTLTKNLLIFRGMGFSDQAFASCDCSGHY